VDGSHVSRSKTTAELERYIREVGGLLKSQNVETLREILDDNVADAKQCLAARRRDGHFVCAVPHGGTSLIHATWSRERRAWDLSMGLETLSRLNSYPEDLSLLVRLLGAEAATIAQYDAAQAPQLKAVL
jgi:hypothetical protein